MDSFVESGHDVSGMYNYNMVDINATRIYSLVLLVVMSRSVSLMSLGPLSSVSQPPHGVIDRSIPTSLCLPLHFPWRIFPRPLLISVVRVYAKME